MIRRFTMYRRGDISETHNEFQRGPSDLPQFEGIVFTDGTTVLRWCTPLKSTSVWASFEDAIGVHGHPEEHYQSELIWHDDPPESDRLIDDEDENIISKLSTGAHINA